MGDRHKSLPVVTGSTRDPIERLADGDSSGVIGELRERLAREPDEASTWLRLGAVYLAIGHLPEAEEALSRSVALDDGDVEARMLLADALTALGRADAAAFQLIQARRLSPNDPRIHRQLGAVFLGKRLFDKAESCLAKASELDPADARVPFLRGLVCDARLDSAAALAHYRRAVELDPDAVDPRCTLADALAAMGELAEALRHLEEALRRDRTNTRIAQNLEVLRRGLRSLESHRLLGKAEAELERTLLVRRCGLERRGEPASETDATVSYHSAEVSLFVRYEASRIASLSLVLVDPLTAAQTKDALFDVMVVTPSGVSERADLATAITLTFLREALGCPMTRAAELYTRVLGLREATSFSGCRIELKEFDSGDGLLVGLEVTLA